MDQREDGQRDGPTAGQAGSGTTRALPLDGGGPCLLISRAQKMCRSVRPTCKGHGRFDWWLCPQEDETWRRESHGSDGAEVRSGRALGVCWTNGLWVLHNHLLVIRKPTIFIVSKPASHALCRCESQRVTANVAAHRLVTSKRTIFIVTSLPCFVKIVEVVSFCVTCLDPHDPKTEMTDPHANFSRFLLCHDDYVRRTTYVRSFSKIAHFSSGTMMILVSRRRKSARKLAAAE